MESLATSFEVNSIIPDMLQTAPGAVATVKFPSGAEVQKGNTLSPTQVKDVPSVSWDASPDQFYTLALTDPDAPSRKDPKFREWNHWLVANIQGNNVSTGETLSGYISSGPAQGSGLHRYVFLVYKQPGKLNFDEPRLPTMSFTPERRGFSISKFAKKYNLGDPIAGNFYQAEWDEYVPILQKKIGLVPSV